MMFPEGVYYDRENEGYRTQRVTGFFYPFQPDTALFRAKRKREKQSI